MAQGPCASTGRPPTGTFLLSGPIALWEATFRVLGPSRFWCSVAHSTESIQETSWPIRARGAEIGGRVCLGTRVYWYVCKCIGMYRRCIGMYIHVKVCNNTYLYVLVCSLVCIFS